jgi:hypothetical protein
MTICIWASGDLSGVSLYMFSEMPPQVGRIEQRHHLELVSVNTTPDSRVSISPMPNHL